MSIKILFGNQIKKFRQELKMSQEQLAFASGLSKNYICDVEKGRRNISLEQIVKLAKSLQMSLSELFSFTYT